MNSKVSVIIPAYNCADYISAAINSCLSQDYDNIEVIIVNDGSADGTDNAISPFLSDSRVIYIEQENKGVSAARNLGMDCATGDYITFLDSDDELGPDTISQNMKLLASDTDTTWLLFPIQRIDKNGNAVDDISPDLLPSFKYCKTDKITVEDAYKRMTRRMLPTCVCGAIYKRGFLDKKFKEGRFEDTIMVMELLRKRCNLMLSPYGTYVYYDRCESFINKEWDAAKWISYINVQLETMQTRIALFPEQHIMVEKEKSRLYYTLRYLKERNRGDNSFGLPLKYFIDTVGYVKPSIIGLYRYILKTVLYRCKKFVTLRLTL